MTKKTLKELPKIEPNGAAPPPPEAEPPHKILVRLTNEKDRLVRELREHRSAWGERNLIAQRKRQSVSSAEMAAFRDYHGELSEQLAGVDRRIGELNPDGDGKP